jgi:hypothetical protein
MNIWFESTALRPIFSISRTSTKRRSSAVKNNDRPSVGLRTCSAGVVRVRISILSATCAVLIQILAPLTT